MDFIFSSIPFPFCFCVLFWCMFGLFVTEWGRGWSNPLNKTSAMFKIEKCTAYIKLVSNAEILAPMPYLGLSRDISETVHVATMYILLLYGAKARNCSSLDELRYKFACTSDRPGCQFPPTNDAFWQHVLHASYQVSQCVHTHLAQPLLWDHAGNGWKIWSDGHIQQAIKKKKCCPCWATGYHPSLLQWYRLSLEGNGQSPHYQVAN